MQLSLLVTKFGNCRCNQKQKYVLIWRIPSTIMSYSIMTQQHLQLHQKVINSEEETCYEPLNKGGTIRCSTIFKKQECFILIGLVILPRNEILKHHCILKQCLFTQKQTFLFSITATYIHIMQSHHLINIFADNMRLV